MASPLVRPSLQYSFVPLPPAPLEFPAFAEGSCVSDVLANTLSKAQAKELVAACNTIKRSPGDTAALKLHGFSLEGKRRSMGGKRVGSRMDVTIKHAVLDMPIVGPKELQLVLGSLLDAPAIPAAKRARQTISKSGSDEESFDDNDDNDGDYKRTEPPTTRLRARLSEEDCEEIQEVGSVLGA